MYFFKCNFLFQLKVQSNDNLFCQKDDTVTKLFTRGRKEEKEEREREREEGERGRARKGADFKDDNNVDKDLMRKVKYLMNSIREMKNEIQQLNKKV